MKQEDGEPDIELGKSRSNDRLSPLSPALVESLPVAVAESNDRIPEEKIEEFFVADGVVPLDDISESHFARDPHRPFLISVSFFKVSREASLGLFFHSFNGVLCISKINLYENPAEFPLRPGDQLMAVDNYRNCSRWTSVQAIRYLNDREGRISMLFRNPFGDPNLHEAVVFKANENDKVGVIFRNDENSRLRIGNISPWGFLGNLCALKEGDYVEAINGMISHHIEAGTARMMVLSSPEIVTLSGRSTSSTEISVRYIHELSHRGSFLYNVTPTVNAIANETSSIQESGIASSQSVTSSIIQPSPAELDTYMEQEGVHPRFIYVKCDRPSTETPLGISFRVMDNKLKIAGVNNAGVLWASPLREGYDVLSIDFKACTHWTSTATAHYLGTRQSGISFVVENPAGSCRYVMAQVSKPTPRSKIGISFRKTANGALEIASVLPSSLFAGSILTDGSEVLAINGIPARPLSSTEAVSIVEHATDTVTILAKAERNAGIVLSLLSPEEATMLPSGGRTREEDDEERQQCNPATCIAFVICIVVTFFVVAAVGPVDGNY